MTINTRYYFGGFLPAAAQQNRSEMWDGTAATYTSWAVDGTVTASRALTAPETADLAAQDAAATAANNSTTLRTRANAALTTNATYLALSAGALTPTALQQTVQVNKLTRECNILIRLVISLLDDLSGT